MSRKQAVKMSRMAGLLCSVVMFAALLSSPALCSEAVNLMLKNASGSSVDVELVDQYGGNFTASIDAGMSQNHALRTGSAIKVGGNAVHTVAAEDEGREVVVAGQ